MSTRLENESSSLITLPSWEGAARHKWVGSRADHRYFHSTTLPCTSVCVCVCVFIKLHITAQSGPVILVILCVCVSVCGIILFILDVRSVDALAGVNQGERRRSYPRLPFAVLASTFIARKIQQVSFFRRPQGRILCTHKLIVLQLSSTIVFLSACCK